MAKCKKMQASEFVRRLEDVAKNHKTLYVMGCFGAPMTERNKARYRSNNDYNRVAARQKMIDAATPDTYGFDCVCLIKAVLWGWNADQSKNYGGATYKANGVPDIGADQMIRVCSEASANFGGIVPGAAVWMPGHIGVYIGGGLAIECTPIWDNRVQITAVGNMGKIAGYNTRTWTKWGKLPYIDYTEEEVDMTAKEVQQMIDTAVAKAVQGVSASMVELGKQLRAELTPVVYKTLEDIPDWGRPTVEKLVASKRLRGNEKGELNLTHDLLRALVVMDRGDQAQ